MDLDAVLDQFESQFDEEEKEKKKIIISNPQTEEDVAHQSQQLSSEQIQVDPIDQSLTELHLGPEISDSDVVNLIDVEIESQTEAPSVRLNASQPDVLSGCIDTTCDSLAEHLESWNPNETTTAASSSVQPDQESPVSSESTSSHHVFESIYDKYPTQSPEQENSSAEVPNADANPPVLVFQPEDLSDDEFNRLLDQLESNESEVKPEHPDSTESESETPVPREMGARPKETRRETHEDEDASADDQATVKDENSTVTNDPPDLVCVAPPSIADSPPPYSEIDPVLQEVPKVTRPTSLELRDNSEEPNINVTNEENPEEEEATNIVLGPPGSTPANPNGNSNVQIPELLQGLSEDQLILGKISPFWVPDSEAPVCMICDVRFTLVKRRHHCRACGKVLCNICCSQKFPLPYLDDKEARVCKPCKGILERLHKTEMMQAATNGASSVQGTRPNPSNPMEYCSTVPPMVQAAASEAAPLPPIMVPVSVLKRFDTTPSGDPKQVMFSDGIRPGGDLTELDEDEHTPTRRSHHHHHRGSNSKRRTGKGPAGSTDVARSMIPPDRLPYVSGRGPVEESELIKIFQESDGQTVPFTLNRNLRVYVSLVLYSPISKRVWNYRTQGLTSVGQDEVVILLVQTTDEHLPPRDIFEHLQALYETAGTGTQVVDMGHTVILSGKPFLGGTQYGGFLYFRSTFQCIDGLDLPSRPFLFAVLLTKWEMPWARVFPLRLLLRLGAEARYYPAPLWSTRLRQTVFKEIGNTIMKLLSDFRNFTYSLPIIRAMVIHMEDKLTTIIIPKNSYSQIQRALQNSNDPVLALGANFSSTADSHLVAVQREEDEPPRNPMNHSDYETQAINILNKPGKVTGASFVVLNGALKSSSGLTAKSSIVEDGIMVQVSQDRMLQIRKALNQMEDCQIDCGPVGAEKPDETVYIKWIENDKSVNAGIKSMIDGSPMDGIMSIRIKGTSQDYTNGDHCIRWTELFLLPTSGPQNDHGDFSDPPDPARVASHIAKAVCNALQPHLAKLRDQDLTPLAVRVSLDPENAGYEAGSNCSVLPQELMRNLDDHLIPVVHGQSGSRSGFELVFHVLEV